LSNVGFHGFLLRILGAYAPMLATLSEWQIMRLLAGDGRN